MINLKDMIHTIRGKQVILDKDLAELYEVDTRTLNRAVKRNIERFPEDFMFQLTKKEYNSLRCQIGTLENGKGINLILSKEPKTEFKEVGRQFITVFRKEVAV